MSEDILYREEITTAISNNVDENGVVKWNDFLTDMKTFIVEKYDGKACSVYKGDWKRRFKAVVKELNYKIGRCVEDGWDFVDPLLKELRSKSKRSYSTTSSSNTISNEEKHRLLDILDSVKDSDKWKLSTGTIVEDVFKKAITMATYEHPAHSFILDTSDTLWTKKKLFTKEEILEIENFKPKAFKRLPQELKEYLDSYEDHESADNIRRYAFSHYLNNEQFDQKWAQQSVITAVDLFLAQNSVDFSTFSEADMSMKVWPFVHNLYNDNYIIAKLGEKSSVSVSLAKNINRNLELEERRTRKINGAKVDILFKHAYDEVGSCEIGRDQVTEVDDKYFDDGCIKLPKTLRDMFSILVKKNPSQIQSFVTVGYLMMGISMEVVTMDVPIGSLICRVVRTDQYEFPQSIDTFAIDLLPLLEVSWKAKEMMKDTVQALKSRKRKVVAISSHSQSSSIPTLRPSYYGEVIQKSEIDDVSSASTSGSSF